MPEHDPSYQNLLEEIRVLARSHYDSADQPYFLSSLGNDLLKKFPDLKSLLQDRPLSTALKDIPEMVVVRHPNSPQRIAVAFAENSARVQELVETFTPSQQRSGALQPKRLQRALVYAFQQSPTDDQEVYVSLGPPIRYHVVPKASPPSEEDMYHISRDLLVPMSQFADIDVLPTEKRNALIKNINQWVGENNIPLQSCYYVRRSSDTGNLLLKLIDAQPAEIRSRIVVPAEVIIKLLARD